MEHRLKQQPSKCIKIVLIGPESTGKTTLALKLAQHYQAVFVPEYSRIYAENQLLCNRSLTKDDVMPIAEGQMQLENSLAPKADTVLVCDTDLLETQVYAETYYAEALFPELEKYARQNTYDLYFLTNVDVPWESDKVRDKPHHRESMLLAFENALKACDKPYVLLTGPTKERFALATKHIDAIVQHRR